MFRYLATEGEEINPLRLPLDELIIGTVAFLIVFFLLARYLFPRIKQTLDERADAIEGGIERAEEAQAEAQRTLEQYRAQLADARQEAARLREEAREQGASIIAEMREEGGRQRQSIVDAGHQQLDADRNQAYAALRQDVGRLAVELASRIVGESLEDEARQRRVVDRFLDELEARDDSSGGAPATTPESAVIGSPPAGESPGPSTGSSTGKPKSTRSDSRSSGTRSRSPRKSPKKPES